MVEKYIHRCVDSIVSQTYTNLEIILVDDGSLDCCGEICDKYAKKDNRIRVIHKGNGGLSSARNEGIDKALGEYLFFIDSDDSICDDCIELLYNSLLFYNSDCSVTALLFVYEKNGLLKKRYNIKEEQGVLTNIEAINTMFYGDKFDVSACGKLFKKQLFIGIRFPEGRIYEDGAIMYKLLHRCHNVSYIGKAKYNYLKRNNGNITSDVNEKKVMDIIELTEETLDYMKKNLMGCYKASIHNLVNSQLAMCVKMSLADDDLREQYRNIKRNIRKYRLTVIRDDRADAHVKYCCMLTYVGFWFVRVQWKMYKRYFRGR